MTKRQAKLIDQVRQAASKCAMSQNALARAAGIDKGALSRFITGERGLSMEGLNSLGEALNLQVVAGKPKAARKER